MLINFKTGVYSRHGLHMTSRVTVEGKMISTAAKASWKSPIKLHNISLTNVALVVIVVMACRVIGCRPRGKPVFRLVAVLFTIYIYTATAAPVVVRRDLAINRTLGFCVRIWDFFAYKNARLN